MIGIAEFLPPTPPSLWKLASYGKQWSAQPSGGAQCEADAK